VFSEVFVLMHTIKGIYENGQVTLPKGQLPSGRQDVIVLFPEINNPEGKDLTAGKRFVEKWQGILKGCNIDDWKNQKADDLQRKPR
jgi:hypothetical protein